MHLKNIYTWQICIIKLLVLSSHMVGHHVQEEGLRIQEEREGHLYVQEWLPLQEGLDEYERHHGQDKSETLRQGELEQ